VPRGKLAAFAAAGLTSLVLDQSTKCWIAGAVPIGREIAGLDPFFHVTHVRNADGSFGVLAGGAPAVRHAVLVGLPLAAIGLVVAFYRRLAPAERRPACALGLVLGGVVGNLVDRVVRGGVVDFLRFALGSGRAWPDFNLADVAVVVGLGLLAADVVALRRARWA
jgi:signal peptidase II